MSYLGFLAAVLPEVMVALAAFLTLSADLFWARRWSLSARRRAGALLAMGGCLASALCLLNMSAGGRLPGEMLVLDALALRIKLVLLVLTAFTALLVVDADVGPHVGEFFALLLLATAAMMFLVSSENLLMIFLSLEMTSLCLYAMTAFNRRSAHSAEAGLKYFLFGGVAAAVMLFGLSLLYGITGEIQLRPMAVKLATARPEPVFYLALVMTVTGLGFKVAAAPFHLWAPDTYQAAPLPGAALVASGSKVASFVVLARLTIVGLAGTKGAAALHQYLPGWVPLLACLAALSMLLGNLAALAQRSVRRLLAFSAVAQAGYVLVGLLAGDATGLAAVLFYTVTYGLTLVGAFGVVGMVESRTGGDSLESFAGLSRRAPLLAFCLLIFMLSLAGIPPLAGFFGKFYLLAAALRSTPGNLGLLWLVVFAVAMSTVSLYYYLIVLKQAYVADAPAGATVLPVPLATQMAISLLALLVLLCGCLPGLLLKLLPGSLP